MLHIPSNLPALQPRPVTLVVRCLYQVALLATSLLNLVASFDMFETGQEHTFDP